MLVTTLLDYLPVAALLAYVTAMTRLGVRVQGWVYLTFAALGLGMIWFQHGLLAAAISAGAAALLFVVLVGIAASRVSGVAVFTLSTAVAMVPWWDWWTLALGLGIALVVSLFHIRKSGGAGRATFLTMETMQAFGVTPTGGVMKPDLGRIPVATKDEMVKPAEAEDEEQSVSEDVVVVERPQEPRIRVPEFLLVGVIVGAAIAVVRVVLL